MDGFMTKQRLTELIEKARELDVFPDREYLNSFYPVIRPSMLIAQDIFEGECKVRPADLERAVETELQRKAQEDAEQKRLQEEAKKEREMETLKEARRGGLSHEELADKIMQGIVNGAFGIRYSEIAPYSHGYEVTFGGSGSVGSTRDFKNRWECYCDFFEIGDKISDKIANDKQDNKVFGDKCGDIDIHEMLEAIRSREEKRITSFVPEAETDFERAKNSYTYPYRSSVASVMDVHAGKGLDGIAQHHYHGDYSSMTPIKQNSLVEMMVCLNGFCLDCLDQLDIHPTEKSKVVDYLKEHGTDISTAEKLEEWIRKNPEKCGLERNRSRKVSLDEKIDSGKNRVGNKGIGHEKQNTNER